MVVTFETSEFGKIEINTETGNAYFHHSDLETELMVKDDHPDEWYFQNFFNTRFMAKMIRKRDCLSGVWVDTHYWYLDIIRPKTLCIVGENGKIMHSE